MIFLLGNAIVLLRPDFVAPIARGKRGPPPGVAATRAAARRADTGTSTALLALSDLPWTRVQGLLTKNFDGTYFPAACCAKSLTQIVCSEWRRAGMSVADMARLALSVLVAVGLPCAMYMRWS